MTRTLRTGLSTLALLGLLTALGCSGDSSSSTAEDDVSDVTQDVPSDDPIDPLDTSPEVTEPPDVPTEPEVDVGVADLADDVDPDRAVDDVVAPPVPRGGGSTVGTSGGVRQSANFELRLSVGAAVPVGSSRSDNYRIDFGAHATQP